MASVLRFFLITFAVSWACFFGSTVLSASIPLLLLGTFAPALVAIGVSAYEKGTNGVVALLRPILQADVSWRWYVFALSYMVVIEFSVAATLRVVTGTWPTFGSLPWSVIVVSIFIATPLQAGEEVGWRGYALPRLTHRLGLASASLVLGAVWALWHLPIFFMAGADKYGQSFPLYALGTISLSVAFAWIYAKTNGSLLLPMLMHSAINHTVGIVPTAVPEATSAFALSTSLAGWISLIWMWIAAGYILVRMRQSSLPSRIQ